MFFTGVPGSKGTLNGPGVGDQRDVCLSYRAPSGATGNSTWKTSRHCRYPRVGGCGSSSGSTAELGTKTRS